MKIVIASDHRGFKLKGKIKDILKKNGHKLFDAGTDSQERTDYPVFARKAADILKKGKAEKGVLICGSGLGICIAANKIRGIRAVTVREASDADMGVRHNNANMVCFGADKTSLEQAVDIINVFLESKFEGGRHRRRLEMVKEMEKPLSGKAKDKQAEEPLATVSLTPSSKPSVERKEFGELASYIDHTLLKPEATIEEIKKLCREAKEYKFATVCVNPSNVKIARELLKGSSVGVTTVVGFPLGATTAKIKAIEAGDAIANGAEEIDMVMNVGALKSGNYRFVEEDIKAVRDATEGKVLKVILETALLSKEQIKKASQLAKNAGADFVKTSTGFGPGGAKIEDIKIMKKTVGPHMGVKASGGVRSAEDARKMLQAGATRIGASASVAIAGGSESSKEY